MSVEHQQPRDSTGRTPSGCCAPATSASPRGTRRATSATRARSSNGIINCCDVDGFQTPFAMGYKMRAHDRPPAVRPEHQPDALSHVHPGHHGLVGGLLDPGRADHLRGGFRADIRQTYFVEASALWYRRGTAYDPMRDRGQYTVVVGYNLRLDSVEQGANRH